MPTYIVHGIDMSSGVSRRESVTARDEQEAMAIASHRGLAVPPNGVTPAPPEGQREHRPAALQAAPRRQVRPVAKPGPGYVDQNLSAGERVVYRARLSTALMVLFIVVGVLMIPLCLSGLIVIAHALAWYCTTELVITNRKIIAKTGLIRRRTVEMFISKVETVQVDQSVLGRMFNMGSVIVSGAGRAYAPIRGIDNPLEFRRAFMAIAQAPEPERRPS